MKSKKTMIEIIEKAMREQNHPFNTYDLLISLGYTGKEIAETAREILKSREVH